MHQAQSSIGFGVGLLFSRASTGFGEPWLSENTSNICLCTWINPACQHPRAFMSKSLLLVLAYCEEYLIVQTEIRPLRAKLVLATTWWQWVHAPFPPQSQPSLTHEPDLACPSCQIGYPNLLHFPWMFCFYHENWPFGWLGPGLALKIFSIWAAKHSSYVQGAFSSGTAGAVLRTDVSTLLGELVSYTVPRKLSWYKYPGKAFVLCTIHV